MFTTDIFPADRIPTGTPAHAVLIDLVSACRGPRDMRLLEMRLGGATQQEIAQVLGTLQQSVSRWLYSLHRRAGVWEREGDAVGAILRRQHIESVPTEKKQKPGLRFAAHTRGHIECWCLRRVA